VDFKKLKANAETKAKPHWDKSEELGNEAASLGYQIKDLRDSLKGEKKESVRQQVEKKITGLENKIEILRLQSKDQQSIGDRHYWPIYNLDRKNLNNPEAEVHDPIEVLEKYKKLISEIADTEAQLKAELSSALSHHFENQSA
jgi:type I restriction enzyme M protein